VAEERTNRGGRLRVEQWRERESTRDAVKGAIRDYLWNDATGLPVAYSLEEVEIRTDAVFQHVF
jgi:type I restriction enzyme R subunit